MPEAGMIGRCRLDCRLDLRAEVAASARLSTALVQVSGAGNATPRSWELHKEAKTEQNGGHLPDPEQPDKKVFPD